jgi:hypothetical protein
MIPPNQKNLMVQRTIHNTWLNNLVGNNCEAALLTIGKGPKARLIWGTRRIHAPPKYLPRVEDLKHANQKKEKKVDKPIPRGEPIYDDKGKLVGYTLPPVLDRRSKS